MSKRDKPFPWNLFLLCIYACVITACFLALFGVLR
jgi:hypothetical protein